MSAVMCVSFGGALLSLWAPVSSCTVSVPVNITVDSGHNVTLPCRGPSNTDILVVEWTRPELEPEYVFMYRDEQPVTENQHPSFKNRVELVDQRMKDGDVSVLLKNVTSDDTGTYECRVFYRGGKHRRKRATLEPSNIIHLQVHKPGYTDQHDEDRGDKEGGGTKENNRSRVGLIGLASVISIIGFSQIVMTLKRRRLKRFKGLKNNTHLADPAHPAGVQQLV